MGIRSGASSEPAINVKELWPTISKRGANAQTAEYSYGLAASARGDA